MKITSLKHYPPYYGNHFQRIGEMDLMSGLQERINIIDDFYSTISDDKWLYQYAPDKWSVAKLIQHIMDAETIFIYRALSIVRGEKQLLIGWEEDEYAATIDDRVLDKKSTLDRFSLITRLTLSYFSSFTENDLKKIGNANSYDTEVAAIGFAIIVHETQHRRILQERYL